MSEADREHVAFEVAKDPTAGVVIQGTGGLRKMRIALPGRGKRGGGRIIYWLHSEDFPVVLVFAFAKNEADDLTSNQRKLLARVTASLIEEFGGKR